MAIYVVDKVTLIPQDKTNGCWYFCAKMMAKWSSDSGKGSIKDPADQKDLVNLYEGNCGYSLTTCGTLASKLGMKALSRSERGFSDYLSLLKNGPLWVAGLKGGANGFPHVVIIAGVADTGVLVLDPLPLNQGERGWKTWKWLNNFLALDDDTFDANLLAPG
jgi:hypothetical protein